MTSPDLAGLRRRMRGLRAALPRRAQRAAAKRVAAQLRRLPAMRNARRIALYLAVRGELDLAPAIAAVVAAGIGAYLPVVQGPRLRFVRYRPGDALRRGHYGIPVPRRRGPSRGPLALQVVLVPLVAFDGHGHRVGSGAGYYDRTLAARGGARRARRPYIVGIAHAFQEVDRLTPHAHDIDLDAVVTPVATRVFARRADHSHATRQR